MRDVKVIDFLGHVPNDEITERLRLIDQSLMELHQHGYYVVCNVNDIDIINDEVTLASFNNKLDYLNSGYNPNGDKEDILELCTIGICAFNHFNFNDSYINPSFMKHLVENLDMYINNGKVPRIMREYYIDVFERGNIGYLNDYLEKLDYENESGRERGITKTKTTAVGKALSGSDKEAAYARVLVIPSILVLVYLVALVCYFIFFR